MSKIDLPIFEQRRIEANIIKPIFEEIVPAFGEEKAKEILGTAIKKNAIEQGRGMQKVKVDQSRLQPCTHFCPNGLPAAH
jgi:hypothetical protein